MKRSRDDNRSKDNLINQTNKIADSKIAAQEWLSDRNTIRTHLDSINLFDKLDESDGLIRIEDFLPDHVADAALEAVKEIPQNEWSIRQIDQSTSLKNDGTTMHEFFVSHVYPPRKANNSKRGKYKNKKEATEMMKNNSIDLLIDTIKSLWPGKRCTFSVGKYNSGNYIAEHDDHAIVTDIDDVLCSRDLAVIYYLTKNWKKEDGGILVDLHGEKQNRYVPKFNSLVAFEVPRFHEVTAVLPREGRDPRYSIFGWFLEEGDIYSYAPASAVEVGLNDKVPKERTPANCSAKTSSSKRKKNKKKKRRK